MVRLTEQQWDDIKKRTGIKDPEGEKAAKEKYMQDLERIQYYAPDLAYALDLGEIADMHVDTENGQQILRMTVVPKAKAEFKTIRTAPKQQTKSTVKRKQTPQQHETRRSGPVIDAENPVGIGEKLVGMGKKFMSNKNKPPWME